MGIRETRELQNNMESVPAKPSRVFISSPVRFLGKKIDSPVCRRSKTIMSTSCDRKKRLKREILDLDMDTDDQSDHKPYTADRRCLRSGYLTIQNLIRDKRCEIAAPTSKKFQSIINEVNQMHHLVKKPREQVSDAEALRDLANTLVASIRVQSTGSVTPSVFVSSLITEYGQKGIKGITETAQILWKDIGLLVSPVFMIGKGSSTMLGPMRYETKPMVTRKRRRRSLTEEKVKPEELKGTSSKEKTETEKIIATMFNILKRNSNVRVENLMLNRISFAQTVENLFALSFLVKDGRVMISVDENGCHRVSPRNAPASSAIMSGKAAYCHFSFRLDFNDWKLMKSVVGEGLELMPHRAKPNSCDGDHSTMEVQKHHQEMLFKEEE